MQLTTYRRNGEPVPTPVNTVVVGGTAFFRTWDVSGKPGRAPAAHLGPCSWPPHFSRSAATGPPPRADAQLLDGVAAQHAARMLMPTSTRSCTATSIPWYHRRPGLDHSSSPDSMRHNRAPAPARG